MTSELYLIRHGESEMNLTPHLIGGRSNETPLTELGIRQARLLGEYFLAHDILPDRVFTSPAVRTMQTAKYTLRSMGLEEIDLIIDDGLQEMDQGEYEGRLRKEVYTPEVQLEIARQEKDFKLPGGESMNEVGERMRQRVKADVPREGGLEARRTFMFTHGLAIRTLASTLYDWSHAETLAAVTDNTSFTLLKGWGDQWRVSYLGATPHLDQLR